jgi:hypothetical protein
MAGLSRVGIKNRKFQFILPQGASNIHFTSIYVEDPMIFKTYSYLELVVQLWNFVKENVDETFNQSIQVFDLISSVFILTR